MNGNVKLPLIVLSLALIAPLLVLLGGGAAAVDDPLVETHAVTADSIRAAEIAITLTAGELWLGPGARGLMDGTFVYSGANRQPQVDYRVAGETGQLMIDQGRGAGFVAAEDWDNLVNDWDIMLSGEVPISLTVEVGAGESVLDLADLTLRDALIRTGAGDTTVDLTGAWVHDLPVSIKGGAGDVKILVPAGGNVEVRAAVGLGQIASSGLVAEAGRLVTEGFSGDRPVLTISVRGGVGTIQVIAVPALAS